MLMSIDQYIRIIEAFTTLSHACRSMEEGKTDEQLQADINYREVLNITIDIWLVIIKSEFYIAPPGA